MSKKHTGHTVRFPGPVSRGEARGAASPGRSADSPARTAIRAAEPSKAKPTRLGNCLTIALTVTESGRPRSHPGKPGSQRKSQARRTLRPKTNFSVGAEGSVVVPSWAVPDSLLTAGIAKYWNVIVVSPGFLPGSTSKIE
jgi:hypothetical protein